MKIQFLSIVVLFLFIRCTNELSTTENIFLEPKNMIKAVDLSFLPEVRNSGQIYYNSNTQQPEDMLVTLKKSGCNTVRLRLFHSPSSTTSSFETVKNLSEEIHNLGMKTWITVHFSDSWADPSQQTLPQAWQNLDYTTLKDSVFNYSKKIALELQPDFVQVGNEINNGFLWPYGNSSNLVQLKELLQQGISGFRYFGSQIIIHYAGIEETFLIDFDDSLDYDIYGVSYYPIWHGSKLYFENFVNNVIVNNISHKKIIIAETSYPFTFNWNDQTNNVIGNNSQILPEFSASPQGQKDFLNFIKEKVNSSNSKIIGFSYWGGEWTSYKGSTATDGSSWENQAFWDFNNQSLPVLDVYTD